MFIEPTPNKVQGLPEGWVLLEYPFDCGSGDRPQECGLAVNVEGEWKLIRVQQPWLYDATGVTYFEEQPVYGLHMRDPEMQDALSAELRKSRKLKLSDDHNDPKWKKNYKEWMETLAQMNSIFPNFNKKEK